MTKRTQQYQLDPNVEELEGVVAGKLYPVEAFEAAGLSVVYPPSDRAALEMYDDSLGRLVESNVVTPSDSQLVWREGHLEHVARLYVSDPALAWRDYSDDLTVALAADGSNFAALVERARSE